MYFYLCAYFILNGKLERSRISSGNEHFSVFIIFVEVQCLTITKCISRIIVSSSHTLTLTRIMNEDNIKRFMYPAGE